LLRGIAAFVILGVSLAGQPAPARPAEEYRVKAAALYNLARFVSWPASSFPNVSAPLAICVLGEDPFGAQLDGMEAMAVWGPSPPR
jgi:hypothetical protein